MHLEGITVVGTLPEAVSITTIFSAATCSVTPQTETLGRLLAFMASDEVAPLKRQHGMDAA
jgi:molybdate transport system substrate-binding protein